MCNNDKILHEIREMFQRIIDKKNGIVTSASAICPAREELPNSSYPSKMFEETKYDTADLSYIEDEEKKIAKEEYERNALETENTDYNGVVKRFKSSKVKLMHAAIGLSTEAGELLDQIKKHLYYGKDIDEINILEEFGDALWYICIGLDAIEENLDSCMKKNNKKLYQRYFFKRFNEKQAIERDLIKERKALEGKDV